MQYSNLAYFGYWASSMDIWLLFTKLNEVTLAGLSVLDEQIVKFIMEAIICLLLFFVLFLHKKTSNKNNGLVCLVGVVAQINTKRVGIYTF